MQYLITLLLVLFLFKSNGQEQCSIVIHPYDTIRNCYLDNTSISCYENGKLIQKIYTDSLGYATLPLNLNDTNAIKFYELRIESTMFSNFINPIPCFDTIIIEVSPRRTCWDAHFGNFLIFQAANIELDSLNEEEALFLLKAMKLLLSEVPDELFIEINLSVYLGYSESHEMIEKRIAYLKRLIEKAEIPESWVKISDCSYNDLFICTYCDGCHYYYLKGQGNWFTKAIYRKLKSKNAKATYNAQRSGVKIGWNN